MDSRAIKSREQEGKDQNMQGQLSLAIPVIER